jgi:hypothetical protein
MLRYTYNASLTLHVVKSAANGETIIDAGPNTNRNPVHCPHPRLADLFELLREAAQSYLIILICTFTFLGLKKKEKKQ